MAAVHGVGVGGAYEPTEGAALPARRAVARVDVRAAADEVPLLASLHSIATAAGEARRRRARRRHRAARRAAAGGRAVRAAPRRPRRRRRQGRDVVDPSRTLNKIVAALTELSTAASLAASSEAAYKADGAALEDLLAHVAWGAEG